MGRVWLGWDSAIERNVAIKEPTGAADSPEARRLMYEAMLTAKLEHAGVVAVHDIFYEDDHPHFVMALVRGETLEVRMRTLRSDEETRDARVRLLRHFREVCEVIGYAHTQGVLHRDITPRNVLIGEDGAARVIDWGLATTLDEAAAGCGPAGTPGHMAPEQRAGAPLDARADVWGLGALLHVILRGTPPPPNTRFDVADATTELEAILYKALAHDPEDRYTDGIEFAAEMTRWFEGRRVEAFDTNAWRIFARFARVYRTRLLVAAGVFAALAAVAAAGVINTQREAERARRNQARAEQEAAHALAAQEREREESERAQRAAAELYLEDAEAALEVGDTWRAKDALRRAAAARGTPRGVALRMRLGLIPELQQVAQRALPPCQTRWFLTPDPNLQLCHVDAVHLQAWHRGEMIWERDLVDVIPAGASGDIILKIRLKDTRLHILSRGDALVVLDRRSGEVLREDTGTGKFINDHSVRRFNRERTRWLSERHDSPCEEGIIQAFFGPDHLWHLCKRSGVWRQRTHRGPHERVHADGIVHFMARIEETGEHWMARADGTIWPLGHVARHVALGQPISYFDAVPHTPYLLVRGWRGDARVLDTRRGDWLASFPDVHDALPAANGHIQIIDDARTLTIWSAPASTTLRRYSSPFGVTDVAWSMRGDFLAVVDGGGLTHRLHPERGEYARPVPIAKLVAKAVAPTPKEGDFVTVNVDGEGIWHVDVAPGQADQPEHLRATLAVPRIHPYRRLSTFADGTLISMHNNGSVALFAPTEDGWTFTKDQYWLAHPTDLAMSPHRERALAIADEGGWWIERDGATTAVAWAIFSAYYGAISSDGAIASTSRTSIAILNAKGQQRLRITPPCQRPPPSRGVTHALAYRHCTQRWPRVVWHAHFGRVARILPDITPRESPRWSSHPMANSSLSASCGHQRLPDELRPPSIASNRLTSLREGGLKLPPR